MLACTPLWAIALLPAHNLVYLIRFMHYKWCTTTNNTQHTECRLTHTRKWNEMEWISINTTTKDTINIIVYETWHIFFPPSSILNFERQRLFSVPIPLARNDVAHRRHSKLSIFPFMLGEVLSEWWILKESNDDKRRTILTGNIQWILW